MKVEKIELYNFGSYEGSCCFDLSTNEQSQRVVVIGGKNGSGKTTFFTAIQLCLYGNFAFGYKSAGHRYLKEVYSLINNNARLKENEHAHITINFQQTNARDVSEYALTRSWKWTTGDIEETVVGTQNGEAMTEEDLQNFQNYLIHLIPPDLLKLYFFDGEKIADYFLSDSKINIREALMILSGNDTFDLLHNNVRRVMNLNKGDDADVANQYIVAQEKYNVTLKVLEDTKRTVEALKNNKEDIELRLEQVRTQYAAKGGLTLEQWDDLQGSLKTEENNREKINLQRRMIATDILPFVILGDWINKILPQIAEEEDYNVYQILKFKLEEDSFRKTLIEALNSAGISSEQSVDGVMRQISGNLLADDWSKFTPLFQLSNDEKIQLHSALNKVFDYEPETLKNYQKDLEKSLKKTKEIRSIIQKSDIEHIEEYVKETTQLEGEIKLIQSKIEQTENELIGLEDRLKDNEKVMANARKAFEHTLKKESVAALSGRVLLLLEDLQSDIYSKLLKEVEDDLKLKLEQLIRKQDFFDDIKIDSDFNVHIIKNQTVSVDDLIQTVRRGGRAALKRSIGEIAFAKILDDDDDVTNSFLIKRLENMSTNKQVLPIEIDKDTMSSGEKQIFVMSLYWSLMQQSDNVLPFIIDTPFARIDTEHRANITKYFFLNLPGQLFILSTNEELDQEHLNTMKDDLAHVYTLEYGEDKRTTIYKDSYFEVQYGF